MNSDTLPDTSRIASHVADGYKNGQEVIRFVDTKTAVTAGFALTIMGCVAAIFKEVWLAPDDRQKMFTDVLNYAAFFKFIFVALVLLSLACGFFSLICAIGCLIARGPSLANGLRQSVLFPYHNGSDSAKAYYAKIVAGLSLNDIAKEYENQILQIGGILQKKIQWHRRSVFCLLTQVLAFGIAAFIFACAAFLSH